MDIKEELKAIIDIELKPEFELAINEVIDKSYKDDIEKLGPDMASLVRSQWEQMKSYLFFAYCLGVKAQAVPEGFVLAERKRLADAVDGIEKLFKEDNLLALGELLPIQQDLNAMIEAQEQKG